MMYITQFYFIFDLISNKVSSYLEKKSQDFYSLASTREELTHLKQAEDRKEGLPKHLVAQARLKI